MIQRIQSLYLLAACIFTGLMLWLPLGGFLAGEQEFRLMAWGLESIGTPEAPYVVATTPMGIVIAAAALLPLITLFLYKNRLFQIRLCFAEIVLLFGVLIFTAYYIYHSWQSMKIFDHYGMKFSIAAVFPLISMIFTFMAFRAIAKDEALVRSLDRIR